MTLLEVTRLIEKMAAEQPAVNMVVRDDIYLLNDLPDVKYGVFAWTQGVHTCQLNNNGASVDKLNFTLFYVDRLTDGRGNATEVQSVGYDILGNVLRQMTEYVDVDEWTVTTFTQRFKDECAGVYASVSMSIPSLPCPEDFSDIPVKGWVERDGVLRRDADIKNNPLLI